MTVFENYPAARDSNIKAQIWNMFRSFSDSRISDVVLNRISYPVVALVEETGYKTTMMWIALIGLCGFSPRVIFLNAISQI